MSDVTVQVVDGRVVIQPFGADALVPFVSAAAGSAAAAAGSVIAAQDEADRSALQAYLASNPFADTTALNAYANDALVVGDRTTIVGDGVYQVTALGPVVWTRQGDDAVKQGADQVALATAEADEAALAADEAQGYASTAGSASVTNLFSVLSQVTSNPPSTASVIQSNGWRITNSAPSDVSLGAVKVIRQGYNTSAVPVFWVDTLYRTKRVRQVYPNQASFTTNEETLSDFVYSTDCVLGLINQSTETSPKPVANWVMPSRLLVASSVHWEIVAFHRNASNKGAGNVGQQVACVRVRANNGTTATAWQTVSATSISTYVEDANPVEVFQNDLDVSALADGAFWLEAEVYPWIGAAASVLKSEDQSAFREFSRRYFRKGSTVNYVYVASTGNDTTGVVSTTPATAAATPCLTVGGALLRARTALGTTTTGSLDGLRIRIVDSVTCGTPNGAFFPLRQDVAGVVIERAPGTARASAIVTLAATFRPGFSDTGGTLTEGSIIFNDVSVVLGGAFLIQGEATRGLDVQFWNCNLNYGSFATTLRSSSHLRFAGVAVSNPPSTALGLITNTQVRMLRGVTGSFSNGGYEAWLTVGCNLTAVAGPSFTNAQTTGTIWFNNKFLNPSASSTGPLVFAGAVAGNSGQNLGGFAMVQNLVELLGTVGNSSMRVAGDSDFGNIVNAVIHHNTLTGTNDAGRVNISYDEHPTVARTHKLISFKGNLVPSLNVKGDDYSLIQNGTRIGHFPFEHGVGCEGTFTKDVNANAGSASFGQAYPGIGSVIAGGDPLFTSNQSVTKPAGSYVAGAGGGTYTLQSGSPAKNLLSIPVMKYDLAGNARGTGTQHAGAYQ